MGGVGGGTGGRLRTASVLTIPLSFGVSLAAASAQTYINRRVPLKLQGRTFAIQSTLRSGAAIVPLVAFGVAATQIGTDRVLLLTPIILIAIGFLLVQASFRFAKRAPPSYLEVASSFWEEPDEEG